MRAPTASGGLIEPDAKPMRSEIARSRNSAVTPFARRNGWYSCSGWTSAPISSRSKVMFADRPSTPSSDANHSMRAFLIASAASGEIAPSDGHTPRGFTPKPRTCETTASSSW